MCFGWSCKVFADAVKSHVTRIRVYGDVISIIGDSLAGEKARFRRFNSKYDRQV
jgi:hypothetical protein